MHVIASSTAVWYAARAGGVVAYLLVSASVLAGITARRQAARSRLPAFRRRGRAPLPRAPRRPLHRDPRRLDRARHRRAVLADAARRSLHGLVSAARDRPRRRRARAPRRRRDRRTASAPGSRTDVWRRAHYPTFAVWLLATGPRHPRRHRPRPGVARLALRADRGARDRRSGAALRPRTCRRAASQCRSWASSRRTRRGRSACRPAAGVLALGVGRSRRADGDSGSSNGELAGTIENDGLGRRLDQRHGRARRRPSGSTCSRLAATGSRTVRCRCASPAVRPARERSRRSIRRGFSGTCNLPDGSTRTVQATWTVSNGTVAGTISTSGGSASSVDRPGLTARGSSVCA